MFALSGSLDSPSVVLININIAFATYGENICLPTTEVILRAAADKLARSKNHQDWKPRNAVLLLPFLTEAAIIDWRSMLYSTFRTQGSSLESSLAPSQIERRRGKTTAETMTTTTTTKSREALRQRKKRKQRRVKRSRPPPRHWPPSHTVTMTSWTFYNPLRSSHRKSPQQHSLFVRTSVRIWFCR